MSQSLIEKVSTAPKTELHMHLEGSLEPEMIFKLAQRNNVRLPYASVEVLRDAYAFESLQSFLDIYHACTSVLKTEEDFYDTTLAYVERALADNVVHAEIFFDPQTHTARGVSMDAMVAGIERALAEGDRRGLSSRVILCFLRHLPEEEALNTLEVAIPLFERYSHRLVGVGLDSTEIGIPPERFKRVFDKARELGLHLV